MLKVFSEEKTGGEGDWGDQMTAVRAFVNEHQTEVIPRGEPLVHFTESGCKVESSQE
jgi:hypothetical protein